MTTHLRVSDVQRAYNEGGWTKIKPMLHNFLVQWRRPSINIAVLGKSSAGKSSFINSLRGLTSDDINGAKTGINIAPQNTTWHTYPENHSVRLWEIKAYTSGDPEQYLTRELPNEVEIDMYILLSAGCFKGKDRRLADVMQSRNYNVIFVRTKIDGDKAGAYRSKPRTFQALHIVEKVRKHCSDILGEGRHAFLICNYKTNSVDFPALLSCLIDEVPQHKQELFLYCLDGLVRGIGEKKRSYLLKRVGHVAFLCTKCIECTGEHCIVQVDMRTLTTEAQFYYQQFGLTKASVRKLAHSVDIEENLLSQPRFEITPDFVMNHLSISVGESAKTPIDQMGEYMDSSLDLLESGQEYNSLKVSFKAAFQFLRDLLNKCNKVNNDLIQHSERLYSQQSPTI